MSRVDIENMERTELVELKLQMGLDPSVAIDPHELRAMWRQLCAERQHARRLNAPASPSRFHAAHTLIPD